MAKKLSVIIPAFNEEKTIQTILEKVNSVILIGGFSMEIIVVNDFSTDTTEKKVKEFIAQNKNSEVKLFNQPINRGKGAAIHRGIEEADGDYIVVQDADNEYNPDEFNKLLQPVVDGFADVVFGSRFMGGEPHRILFFWHSVGNKLLTTLSNMFTNLNLTDMETCYKVFRRQVLDGRPLRAERYGFDPEITARFCQAGARIYEVPISYSGRSYAEGKKITWKDGLVVLWTLIRCRLGG